MAEGLAVGITIGAALGASAGRVFGQVEERTGRLRAEIGRTTRRTDHQQQAMKRLRQEQARAGDGSGALARRIQRVGDAMNRAKRQTANLRTELRYLRRAEEAGGKTLGAFGRAGKALAAGYAAQRLIGDAGIAHERAVAYLGTLPNVSEAAVGRAVEQASERVRAGGASGETEQLQVHYELSSAGLSADAARFGTIVAEKVAVATRGNYRDTALTIGRLYNQFGDELEGGTEEPSSDAREGPLSRLTASGRAILPTIGVGVGRAGPGALRRPLQAQLAAAAAGLALAVAAPGVEAAAPRVPGAAVAAPAVEAVISSLASVAAPEPRGLPDPSSDLRADQEVASTVPTPAD